MEKVKYNLNRNHAECIKHWRCNQRYTWRGIARLVAENFPEVKGVCNGNQIDGMDLCDQAMEMLGEAVSDGWN